jgi:hypothetical protein
MITKERYEMLKQADKTGEDLSPVDYADIKSYEEFNFPYLGMMGSNIRQHLPKNFPKIICLCGSTRFYNAFKKAYFEESMKGNIVLSVGFHPDCEDGEHNQSYGITPEQKVMLDELHKRKIDLSDEIYVLNVGGYIGESTRSELEYAKVHGKVIRYLETPNEEWKIKRAASL